jgi:transposase-like protein
MKAPEFKKTPENLSIVQIVERFRTDEAAREHLESIRWENGIVCPHCQCGDASKFSGIKANPEAKVRAGLRYCAECKKQFTVTVGTIFEDSHIPLRKWLIAWYMICTSKKGISSLQMQRMLELGSYRTALFMTHRIRHALRDPVFTEKLIGTVEVDECYFGPKTHGKGFRRGSKSAVVALVERETGTRRSVVVHEKITGQNLQQAVRDHVAAGSTINTDEHHGYKGLAGEYKHKIVTHGSKGKGKKREFHRVEANGEVVSTNFAESSFSLLRRGVVGTFHSISRKHLPLYVAEFDFRFNNRKASDGERTVEALRKAEGKRLTYKQPSADSRKPA